MCVLNVLLEKTILNSVWFLLSTHLGNHLVDIVDVDEGVICSDMPGRVRHVCLGSISMDSA